MIHFILGVALDKKKNKQRGRQQRKRHGNRTVVAELRGKTGNDQNSKLGFLPMAVAETSFLVNRLGQDCEPMQFVRELTQNSIEAIVRAGESGEIRWDRIRQIFPSGKSGFKLSITDTGDGMTGEELERHINQLSASGSQQDLSGNFGVGAKISTAPANPIGVVYRSWKHGQGHQVWLHQDPIGQYGLRQYSLDGDEYTYHPPVPDSVKPSLIQDHGTQVILMGASEVEDTTKPPEGIVSSLSWISKYLNSRYFQFPNGVAISVQETAAGQAKAQNGKIRRLTGQRPYLEDHSIASGIVKIPSAKAHWWILNDDRSLAADAAYIESAGHVAALYQNELYELRSGRAGTSRLQQFGVIFGFRRVVIYVEPRSSNHNQVTSNTTRSHLLLNNQPLPWEDWAAEFRKNMPPALHKFVEDQGAEACGTDHSQIVHKRIEKVCDLFRAHRYRLNPAGNEAVGSGGGKANNRSSANGGKEGHKSGAGNGRAPQENGKPATKINQLVYPKAVWISNKDGTREPGFLEDRAAAYLSDQNLLQINGDFWVFDDMIEHCARDIAGYPGAIDMAATTARAWYEQVLTETVIGIRALRNRKEWSDRDVEQALSPEALTAAVMQRYHIATSTKRDLHRKFHVTTLA